MNCNNFRLMKRLDRLLIALDNSTRDKDFPYYGFVEEARCLSKKIILREKANSELGEKLCSKLPLSQRIVSLPLSDRIAR
jgi:hypothetical protein